MRIRLVVGLVLAMATPLVAPVAFGVGGGSGGSTPTCTADTWSCSGWSTCSTAGQQARSCTMTYDCPSANTPRPAETQSCTPPTPPPSNTNTASNTNQSATNSSDTNTSGQNANTNRSTTNTSSTNRSTTNTSSSCTADTWQCGDWPASCDSRGRQERQCTLVNDCASVADPSPETFRPCDKLQCGQLETRRARIACRLNLAPDGLARELAIEFLPEACRQHTDAAQRQECINYYKGYQPCWSAAAGPARAVCARNILKLGPVVSDEVRACQGKTGQERVSCQEELKDKVFDLVKFRFYDLEQRAEALGERGASIEAVAGLVDLVEGKKIAFGEATTKAARRQIVLDVRQAWQQFITSVRSDVK